MTFVKNVINMSKNYKVFKMRMQIQRMNINNYEMKWKKNQVNMITYQKPTITMKKNVSNQKTLWMKEKFHISKNLNKLKKNLVEHFKAIYKKQKVMSIKSSP